MLYDLPGRHFYIFGLTIQVQDIFWLAGVLIIFAILLFFVTGLGRAGLVRLFLLPDPVDRSVHHDRAVGAGRTTGADAAGQGAVEPREDPQEGRNLRLVAAGRVLDRPDLHRCTGSTRRRWWWTCCWDVRLTAAYFTTFFLTATTFVMAGLAREQVCTYMCPYARFQSAMFDTGHPDRFL
ncbi:MAG: hypothetical protein MZV65_41420 [Chromatiales bacterium]|nr:hypothetical protein [Chromatiales bacterium]